MFQAIFIDFHTYTPQFYFTEYMPPTNPLYLDWPRT
jgi:hypothetical protein